MKALLLAWTLAVLSQPCLVLAGSQASSGTIQLWSDGSCTQQSGNNQTIDLDSCLNTNQVAAISAASFPSCPNGQAYLEISDVNNCNAPSIWPLVTSDTVGQCLSFSTGAGIGSAGFQCPSDATSTTVPPSNPTTSDDTSQSSQTTANSSPAAHVPQSSSQTSGGGSKLSQSDKINIAIGVSIGLAALIVSMLSVFYARWGAIIQLRPQRISMLRHEVPLGPPPSYHDLFELRRDGV